MSEQRFELVSFEPWKDGVVRIRIAADEPEGRVCHTFYARQEDHDDRVKEREDHAAEVARLREALLCARDALKDWGSYAPEYFQQKHGLANDIAAIDAALARAARAHIAKEQS